MMKIQRVVLIGAQAQGKSTFFNKITNQNQKTSYAGNSCTRQIVQGTTVYGQGFEVIDTPGFDSSQDKLLHTAGIIAALTYGIVNRILIVTKYERNDLIIKNLELVFRPINRYRSIVTVIFTHWDLCVKSNEEMEKQRIKELIGNKFKLDSFLCFSQYNEPKNICIAVEKILLSSNQEESIKLYESEIFKNFDIMELNCDNSDKLSDHVSYIQREFRKIANSYKRFIKSLETTNPNYSLILHEIILKITEEASLKVEEFEKKNGEEILQMVDIYGNNLQYLHYIYLKKEIRMDVEQVRQDALQRMKESKFHFFNFLRRCPYCREIWFKVQGCDGQTECGKVADKGKDAFLLFQQKKKIQLIRNEKNELQCIINQNEREEFLEEILSFISNKSLKEKLSKNNELEEILKKIFGDKYREKLIEQFIQGGINQYQLIQKIENALQLIESEKNKQNKTQTSNNSAEQNTNQNSTQSSSLLTPPVQFENIQPPAISQVNQNIQAPAVTQINQSTQLTAVSQVNQNLQPPDVTQVNQNIQPPIVIQANQNIQALAVTEVNQSIQSAAASQDDQNSIQSNQSTQISPLSTQTPILLENQQTSEGEVQNIQNQLSVDQINQQVVPPQQNSQQDLLQVETLPIQIKAPQELQSVLIPPPTQTPQNIISSYPLMDQTILPSELLLTQAQKPTLPNKLPKKQVGCGRTIVWSKLEPLSQEELNQLFSTELLEYFADQEKLQKEETDWLSKEYKDIVNEAIINEKAKIQILEKKNLNQEQQNIQQE